MYHYTYLITYENSMMYMGVRSCIGLPIEDKKYIGSSKHTLNHLITNKTILATYPSRIEAVEAEIRYHNDHNVAVNPLYYNRAKQTSTNFDTTGVSLVMSPEHRAKIQKALTGRTRSKAECIAISKGKLHNARPYTPHSEATKQKISLANKGKINTKEHVSKMVATRIVNGNYNQTLESKQKISETLLKNPPNVTKVRYITDNLDKVYRSIIDCSRDTGIKLNTLKGRLHRKPACMIKGWSIQRIP